MKGIAGECGNRVGRGTVTWPCQVPKGHDGPCMAPEDPPSARVRQKWVIDSEGQREAEEARAVLRETQGDPAPFWELRGEPGGGTTHPGAVVREDVEDHPLPPPSPEHAPAQGGMRATQTSDGLRQRPGDQPLPKVNQLPSIQALVVQDIQERTEVGIQRYGTPLQPFNGRDAARDAYEEVLDLVTYFRQVRYEHSVIAGRLREIAMDVQDDDLANQIMGVADVLDPIRG